MGIRGELFSTKISCEGRTYFFNVKQNRMGDVFLSIVESKPTETETFDRRSIVVFREDMRGFLKAFQTTLGYMEKPGTAPTEMIFKPEDGAPRRPKGRAATPAEIPDGQPREAKSDAKPGLEDGQVAGGREKRRRVVVRKKTGETKA